LHPWSALIDRNMPHSPSPAAVMVEADVKSLKTMDSQPIDAAMAAPILAIVPAEAEAPCLALVPFGRKRGKPTARAAHIRKTIDEALKQKTSDEFKAELLASVEASEQSIAKVTDIEKARDAEVQAAQAEYDAAQAVTAESFEKHLVAARVFKEAVHNRILLRKKIDERGDTLLDAKKQLAMLQVLRDNQVTMRRLQEQKELAVQAAREAKRSLLECRQRGKQSLESAVKQAKRISHEKDVEVTVDNPVATPEKRPRLAEREDPAQAATIAADPASDTLEASAVPVATDEKRACKGAEEPSPMAFAAAGGA